MPDTQIAALASSDIPKVYDVPESVQFLLKAVQASFDGSGAAGAFLPCVTLLSDSGHVIARAIDTAVSVAAGASAEVSFFPHVKHAPAATGGGSSFPFLVMLGNAVNVAGSGGDVLGTWNTTQKFTNSPATFAYTLDGSGKITDVLVNGPCLLDVTCQYKWNAGAAPYDRTTLINVTPSAAETFNGVTRFGVSPDDRVTTDAVYDGTLRAIFPTRHNNCDINVEALNRSANTQTFTAVYLSIIVFPLNPS